MMKSSVLFIALMVWLVVRLAYNSVRELVPDEAYYWVWSRQLAAGYLDHPPMVAWMIAVTTRLFGTNEFGVRLGATMLTLGSILFVLPLVRIVCPDRKAMFLAGWILVLTPMTAALGTIVTPDTPVCFFSIAALFCAVKAIKAPQWWLGFGVCVGLALDSKYTAVLLPASVGLALLTSRVGRKQLASIWPWLGLAVAAIVFLPVVRWNQQHNWASFRFQLSHGTSEDASSALANLGSYWGGQLGIYSPVLFIMGAVAMFGGWRRYKQLALGEQMILIAATFPLVFFCVFAVRHRPEANWPVFAYWPMTVLLAARGSAFGVRSSGGVDTDSPNADRRTPNAEFRGALIVAAAFTLAAHLPEMIKLVPVRTLPTIPNPWEEMFGWDKCGQELDDLSHGAPVFCTTYENASEASFYMAGHPDVWTIDTNRRTEFDFFPGRPDVQSLERAVCVTRAGTNGDIPAELKGFPIAAIESWETTALNRVVRRRRFIILDRRANHP
jgi:4-amino-4-deoxy-L-arabinose transferase-like glycosyltransferase